MRYFLAIFLLAAGPLFAQPADRAAYDAGPAAPETRLERMILLFQPTSAQETELEDLLRAQQDPASPSYHRWLTPEAFADRFGASPEATARVLAWLGAQGFIIDELPAGGRAVIFSGNASQVGSAFGATIHRYRRNGELHLANVAEPRMPEELAGVLRGIVSLHDFRRKPMHRMPQYSAGQGYYYLAPGDFATIYDLAPLYSGGITGAGQSIAIVARCNIPTTDPLTFRKTFGLLANPPNVIVNGKDPGIVSEDELAEADLDVQWSGAAAPQAAVNLVVSASTYTTDGVDLSAQYIVSHNLAAVMSTSFGSCEASMGVTERSFYNSLWQQAAAQGITALVASGDNGAAGCDDPNASTATAGAAVNGLCSTPYSVCVGGTEFNEGANPGQYWSVGNSSSWVSALGYIPEKVWNESGAAGSGLWAGGGGASAYYAKPSWQAGPGVPADGKRDVPDVSLSAAGHDAYLMYMQGSLVGIAGTSAASPAFAGIMALVNQQTGSRQGNANVTLYGLAGLQASGGLAYFHDIVTGSNGVPGAAGFAAGPGYDRASGLGSVDGAVLVGHWNDGAGTPPNFSLTVSPSMVALAAGGHATVAVQVVASGGFHAGLSFSATNLPAGLTAVFGGSTLTLSASSTTAAGTYAIGIVAAGGGLTKSVTLPVTIVAPAGCALAANPAVLTVVAGSSASIHVTCGSTAVSPRVTGMPQGVSYTLAPGTLTLVTTILAPLGVYSLSLSATQAATSLPLILTISPAPAFTLSLTPSAISVVQGASGQVTVNTSAAATLSVSGLPAGVSASFLSHTLTIQAAAAAAPGTYNLTVKAVSGGTTKTATLQTTIQAPPGFKLSLPPALTVAQGSTGAVAVTSSTLTGGFNSSIALSINAANGFHAMLTPPSIAAPGTGSSILSFAPDTSVVPGVYSFTVTARSGALTRTGSLTLTVTSR